MQSQNYFYEQLRTIPGETIAEAVDTMPGMPTDRKSQIIKALRGSDIYYGRENLASWLHQSLTVLSLGIALESAIWDHWKKLTAKK